MCMSRSVTPLQFLVQVYTLSSSCTVDKFVLFSYSISQFKFSFSKTGPSCIDARPPGACVGVDINQTVVESAIFTVGCAGVTLSDVLTTSPPGIILSIVSSEAKKNHFM
jgi:hypothetical protein